MLVWIIREEHITVMSRKMKKEKKLGGGSSMGDCIYDKWVQKAQEDSEITTQAFRHTCLESGWPRIALCSLLCRFLRGSRAVSLQFRHPLNAQNAQSLQRKNKRFLKSCILRHLAPFSDVIMK
jgi:hypothetical protein